MANLIVSAVAQWNGRALKTAGKDVSAFDKGVKKLGKTLASVFAAQKIYQFGRASLKAFSEDEAAAVKLAKAVDNLGLSYSNSDIAKFVGTLEAQAAVSDDLLRPSLQALLTTTGDLAKSQAMLTDAIDISRGSGIDLATVSQDLANGYVGITKGLKKYNLGLTQAQLKTKSFEEIMGLLNKQFNGASAAYLATYAGKMDVLTVASDNAKETVGKGLVEALTIAAGKDADIQDVADAMQNLADNTADALRGLGYLTSGLQEVKNLVPGANFFSQFLGAGKFTPIGGLIDLGKKVEASKLKGTGTAMGGPADFANTAKQVQAAAAKAKADKKNLEIQKSLNKIATDKLKKDKQAALTAKQNLLFNQNAISLVAALKGKLSDEERNKLELMLALEVGNVEEANKLSQKVALASDQTGQLALFLRTLPDAKNPFSAWGAYLDGFKLQLAQTLASTPLVSAAPGSAGAFPNSQPGNFRLAEEASNAEFNNPTAAFPTSQPADFRRAEMASMATPVVQNFSVTVNNPIGNGIADLVQQGLLDAARLGHNLIPAGSL